MVARRKIKAEILHFIFLVVVGDGIAEVDRIGRVGNQRIVQCDRYGTSQCRHLWHLGLRGRDDDFFARIFDLNDFIKFENDFVFVVIKSSGQRCAFFQYRRCFVFGSASGASHIGARNAPPSDKDDKSDGKAFGRPVVGITVQTHFRIISDKDTTKMRKKRFCP